MLTEGQRAVGPVAKDGKMNLFRFHQLLVLVETVAGQIVDSVGVDFVAGATAAEATVAAATTGTGRRR